MHPRTSCILLDVFGGVVVMLLLLVPAAAATKIGVAITARNVSHAGNNTNARCGRRCNFVAPTIAATVVG